MDRHLQVPLLSQTYIVRFKAYVRFAYLAMNMLLTQRKSGCSPPVAADAAHPAFLSAQRDVQTKSAQFDL